ncbi:restriction endonuclease subunit S [Planctobacterium marinum]|uniref:restriction endonuclease subunit S n=1 Tax=Planctobacterium marinum TaxID=1631968 RepID=UPI001E2BECAA|nr:restriction endonuclease subunit S [Planctobacterium marinum]MCC2607925.1 restriction endonuclease subunit S [Planctobacterium marinum]
MVPEGWSRIALAKIAEVRSGVAKGKKDIKNPVQVPYLRVANVQDGYIDLTEVKKIEVEQDKLERYSLKYGDVLMNEGGDYDKLGRGDVWLEQIQPCLHQNHVFAVRPDSRILDSFFLAALAASYYGKTYFLSCAKRSTNLASINSTQLKEFPTLVPPLPEQRKIATILSTWDKAISTTERLIDNSKQQKKALMQQLLTGKKRLLDDSGKPFEGVWEEITLENLAKYRRGSFPQPYGNPAWVDEVNGYPFIQVYDIDKNMKLKPDTKIKISDAAIGKSVFMPKETVIVSLQGSIGRVAITQYDAYVDRTVLLFQEFIVPMDKVFFAYTIQKLFEIEKTKAPGGTIKTITKEVLSNFKVHIPSFNEQQKISSVLINADQEIEVLEQQLADLKQEKKALMQQLLTGKRRVKLE